MKCALLVYSRPTAFDPAALVAIGAEYVAFSQAIIDFGEMVGGDPLASVDEAVSVRVRDTHLATTPGPFATTEEVLTGYYLVDVKDLDLATELAARIPDARTGVIEVRPRRLHPHLTQPPTGMEERS